MEEAGFELINLRETVPDRVARAYQNAAFIRQDARPYMALARASTSTSWRVWRPKLPRVGRTRRPARRIGATRRRRHSVTAPDGSGLSRRLAGVPPQTKRTRAKVKVKTAASTAVLPRGSPQREPKTISPARFYKERHQRDFQ